MTLCELRSIDYFASTLSQVDFTRLRFSGRLLSLELRNVLTSGITTAKNGPKVGMEVVARL